MVSLFINFITSKNVIIDIDEIIARNIGQSTITTPHTIFHNTVIGYTSPYPTVDIVTNDHHILFGISTNPGFTLHSTAYIANEAIIQQIRKNAPAILYL